MSLLDILASVDRRLQQGANVLARKANELDGLGNYQISNGLCSKAPEGRIWRSIGLTKER